jgi:hypothetical protein
MFNPEAEPWYVDGSGGQVDKYLNIAGRNLIERIAYVVSRRPGRGDLTEENWKLAELYAKYGLLRQTARRAGKFQLPDNKEET